MDSDDIIWPSPPDDFSIDAESAHVWALSLRVSGVALGRLVKTLSPAERERAASFHFERDRNRFMAGRGSLRMILGRYLRADPATVELTHGAHGKPLLAGDFDESDLHFNLAHCEDLAVLAVARGRVVGIDLERIRGMEGAEEIAGCFCSPRENAQFESLPARERDAAFFRIWTRKEAWLKATGNGIGHSLEKVEVTFQPGEAPRIVGLPETAGVPASGWSLRELTPAPGFVAALALPGAAPELGCWKWKMEKEFEYA